MLETMALFVLYSWDCRRDSNGLSVSSFIYANYAPVSTAFWPLNKTEILPKNIFHFGIKSLDKFHE